MSELTSRVKSLDESLWRRLELFRGFVVANKGLVAYLVAVAVAAFGYDVVTFSLKTDSELHALHAGAKLAWIGEGRWAMYYLNAGLMPDPVMPFVPTLTGLVGVTCGALFFFLSLSGERTLSDYLAAPLAIACPLLAFGFYFTTLSYGLGVAVAATGAGLYAVTRWRWGSAAWAVACFAIAIGIYQSTLLLMPVLFGFYLVVQIISVPRLSVDLLLRRVGAFLAVVLAACALYELIRIATLHAYHVPRAMEYLQGYLNWPTDRSSWGTTIRKTLATGKAYYTGGEAYYLDELRIVAVLFWLTLAVTVAQLVAAPQSISVKIVGLLALGGSLCAPLLMHLLNDGYMPPRTVLGVPFVLAGLVFAASFNGNRTVKLVLGVLVLSCFFKFVVVNSRYTLANELSWKADQDLSLLILQRAYSVLHKFPDRNPPYPVALVGALQPGQSPLYVQRDLIGSSFYNTNGGNVGRVVGLWRSMRHFDFRAASDEEALAVAGRAVAMPVWPVEGSVDVVNGVIVVKIGEYTPKQITTLCDYAPTSDFCERHAQVVYADSGNERRVFSPANYQGLWWNAPGGSQAGWGIELAHQGETIYASWFTHDLTGRSWWLVMSARRRADNAYTGTLFEMRGPPLAAEVFNPADVISTPVGSGTLKFSDPGNGTFDYTVKGIRQTRTIAKAVFGKVPTCTSADKANPARVTNYQGLWWAASEPGWGINVDHQDDAILATWFTYDLDGAPLWLAVTAAKTGPGVYAGDLYRQTGARFDAIDPVAVRSTKVGTATLAFADGDNATFAYTIEGVAAGAVKRTKAITRTVFVPPGTVCR